MSKSNNKVTDSLLTPFEYTRILQFRAKRLALGDPPKIKWPYPFDPIAITKAEIDQQIIPVILIRKIPDNSYVEGYREELWDIKNMDVRDC